MKSILTITIFLSLVVSGAAQTRNVVVGTNGAVVSPTNFWSADVTNARSGLGLGTAATNAVSAFQPSSVALSNLAAGNGGSLTNITATIVGTNIPITNVVGLQSALDGKLATNGNTTGTASNVTGVVSLANGGTAATNALSARASLGATTVGGNIFTLANPDDVRFLRLNANNSVSALTALDMRAALSVGTNLGTVTSIGMTVPSFLSVSTPTITSSGTFALTLANQTSRQVLIAPNGGGVPAFRGVESDDLPSLAISKITGLQTALDGKLATNGTATLAANVTGIVALTNGGTGGSNAATGRTGLGATTAGANIFTLVNPSAITFLRLNADNTVSALSDSVFRTAIGLGTAATNPATAFQPSSSVLTNLASSNGSVLTNIAAANVTGTIAISNGGSGATTAGGARTNIGLGNISTNAIFSTQTAVFANTNFVATNGVAIFTNLQTSYLEIGTDNGYLFVGGTNATNIVFEEDVARTNFLRGLGLGPTNNVAFNSVRTGDTIIADGSISWDGEKIQLEERTFFGGWTVGEALTVGGPIDVLGQTNKATTRTNLGLGSTNSVVFSNLSLSNGALTNLAIALGATNRGFSATSGPERIITTVGGVSALTVFSNQVDVGASLAINGGPLSFTGANAASNSATTRTNLGLGWSALTNSNAGTRLVSVNTNGEVVSPTNFWQVAPIVTRFVEFDPATNATTNVVAARNLHIHSLAISRTGVTSTIALPITNSFDGDIALVVHQGPTSSVTAVRTVGATNNLVTMNQFEQTVEFVYYNNVWQFNHNRSFIEPIFFSGTNAAANAGASRTNLGLGATNNVVFNNIEADGLFDAVNVIIATNGTITFYGTNSGFDFSAGASASQFREDLGLPLAALTNTNNATFQEAVFTTNSAPTNGANFGDRVGWMGVSMVTNGVTNIFRIPIYK